MFNYREEVGNHFMEQSEDLLVLTPLISWRHRLLKLFVTEQYKQI